ncbi:MAG: hypothetical protein ACRC01_01275 [Deefgea sp.]
MNLSTYARQDWLLIRNPIVWLGGAMLVAGVLLLGTQIYLYFSQQEQAALRQQLQQVRASADAAQVSWDSVQQHQADFNLLQRRSIYGAERRLDWIEALAAQAKLNPALQLQYQFAPQQVLAQSLPMNNFQVHASAMKLGFLATNETVFSDLTQWLSKLPGYAVPAACLLQRAEQIGIAVSCDYLWLTIAPVKAEVAP